MSDGDVESLFGGPTGEREVSSACVEGLEYLLERARNGEVIGFAASFLHADGTANYCACGHVGGYSMLGALEIVRCELVDAVRD